MPVIDAHINERALAAYKHISFENLVAAWLMSDGWEVLIPAIDHGKKLTWLLRMKVLTIEYKSKVSSPVMRQ